MKRIIIVLTLVLTLTGGGVSSSASSNQVKKVTDMEEIPCKIDLLVRESGREPRFGFRWQCSKCGYNSSWHFAYETALDAATAHEHKYKHYGATWVSPQ